MNSMSFVFVGFLFSLDMFFSCFCLLVLILIFVGFVVRKPAFKNLRGFLF